MKTIGLTMAALAALAATAGGLTESEILERAKDCPTAAYKPRDILVSKPDYVVYVPEQPGNRKLMDPKRVGDSYNDHFQVLWDVKRSLFYAFWTQASWEGAGDHHICFSKSADRGLTWTKPIYLAGSLRRACKGIDASWQQPMLSKTGRLYCLWNYRYDGGYRLYGFYSDDVGETWSDPKHLDYKVSPAVSYRGWINWQRPLRLGRDGRYFVGSSLGDAVEFWEFDNIDDDPETQDIRISYFAREKGVRLGGERMKEEPKYFMPVGKTSPVVAEASVVKLPDARLFALMRSSVGHPLWSQSRDQGRTWSDPKILRTKDGGRKFLHPCSPCPIYEYAGCEAGSGRYFAFVHDTFDFANTNTHYQTRGPYFMITGKFSPKAEQPVEFSETKTFVTRTDGWNSFYTSYTVESGRKILWIPDKKYYLIGREIGEEWFKD